MNKITTRYGKALTLAVALTGALALGGCAHGPSRQQVGIGAGAVEVALSAMCCLAALSAPSVALPPARWSAMN